MNIIDKNANEYKVRGFNNAVFLTFNDALYAANGETSRIRVSSNDLNGVKAITTAKKAAKLTTTTDEEISRDFSIDTDSIDTELNEDN